MLDINLIRTDPNAIAHALGTRGPVVDLTEILAVDERVRANATAQQALQSRRNALSTEIGEAMRAKDHEAAQRLREQVQEVNAAIPIAATAIDLDTAALRDLLLRLPNLPAKDVLPGASEADNTLMTSYKKGGLGGGRSHDEIGRDLGMMDFETAVQMSGSRFVILSGALARLERALGQFMLDMHTGQHGYHEVSPPILVKENALIGTGQFPKFVDDVYATGSHYLIPTAEVSLTNLVAEKIIEPPHRYTALTPCFRLEAGASGKDTRGMLRQHQFMKCELVAIVRPEEGEFEHERMRRAAEAVLIALELPFRTMRLCTGDLGFSARRTYDLEVWLPGQSAYREISSVSWCGDFQARRMKARCRGADGKTQFVHTLNGSGLAVGRTLIAIMENYQTENGFRIPRALRPYMGGIEEVTSC